MKNAIKHVFFGLFFSTALLAQDPADTGADTGADNGAAAAKPVCETMDAFNDFDFWLGNWNVYSNDESRSFQGTNAITKHHQNCLIMENWTNARGGTGRSMNYYDPVEDQWRQLWVAGGYSIDYTGGLNETGSMVLTGKINYYKTGKSQAFRGTWTLNIDGSVRQFFEQQDTASAEWKTWFDGLYIRKIP
jgi:hypothetical protein